MRTQNFVYIYIYLGTLRYHFFLAIWPEWTVRRNSPDMGGTESIWSNLGFQEFQKVSQPIPSTVFSVPGHLCWDTYLNSLVRPPCSLQTLCEQLNAISQFFHQQSPVNLQLLGSTSTTKVFHFFPHLVSDGIPWLQQRDDHPTEGHRTEVVLQLCLVWVASKISYSHISSFPDCKDLRTCQNLSGAKCSKSSSPTVRPKRTSRYLQTRCQNPTRLPVTRVCTNASWNRRSLMMPFSTLCSRISSSVGPFMGWHMLTYPFALFSAFFLQNRLHFATV